MTITQMKQAKALYSKFAIARESATMACFWWVVEWQSFMVEKEGLWVCSDEGCWHGEAGGR